jgi:hypothetical protein
MDIRIQNQFNNLYTITNNPDDVIPYKYFTNSFNGIPHNKIDMLLDNLNIYKSSVNYNNIDNMIINAINSNEYLLNKNNVYNRQFIENYSNKDKFKLLSVMGVKEKNINISEVINKDLVSNIVRPLESIDIIINQLRSVISSLERLKNEGQILDDYKHIDLSVLIESGIKNNSLDVLNK